MATSMQKISFNCPDDLADLMKKRAEKLDGGVSEVIRLALEQYFQTPADSRQGNMQLVLSKFSEQTYEIVKTRAFCRRIADKLYGEEKSDELLALAEADLEEHLKKRRTS